MQNFSKKAMVMLGSVALLTGAAATIAMQTHAQTTTQNGIQTTMGNMMGRHFKNMTPPAAMGQVTQVNGTTITVTDKKTGTTFSVDTQGATIEKFDQTTPPTKTTISVSQINVGDTVMIQGTVSGTTITATQIIDGMPGKFGHERHGAAGTVTSVQGSTITLSGKNGTTYTVEAGNSKFEKISDSSLSDIHAGDTLRVDGTVSGTTITAQNIVSGKLPEKDQAQQ